MLLSIDRVLQLLAEGKSIDKIAELAHCGADDVSAVIDEARKIINKYEKPAARKKVILKKQPFDDGAGGREPEMPDMFHGAELSAIPVDSVLIIYTDGVSQDNPGKAGIGIVIFDREERQIAKVSASIGIATNHYAEYMALIRALKIALYFKVRTLKIRTDCELMVKQVLGEFPVKLDTIKKLHEEVTALIAQVPSFRIEQVYSSQNEKADFLARKACS